MSEKEIWGGTMRKCCWRTPRGSCTSLLLSQPGWAGWHWSHLGCGCHLCSSSGLHPTRAPQKRESQSISLQSPSCVRLNRACLLKQEQGPLKAIAGIQKVNFLVVVSVFRGFFPGTGLSKAQWFSAGRRWVSSNCWHCCHTTARERNWRNSLSWAFSPRLLLIPFTPFWCP